MDGQKTRGNGGVGIQQSTINNKIDGVWHGGSNGGSLEKNRSNGMDGRPGASGAQTTMTIWQSRRRQSISLRYSSDSIRPRRRSRKTGWEWGISSRTMEWCFIGVGDAEGQRHDRIHCQKTEQIVAVHALVWHCTATLRKSKRVSQHAFSQGCFHGIGTNVRRADPSFHFALQTFVF